MNQRLQQLKQLARSSTWGALLLFLASCGQAPLSDDQSGFIDLVAFYPVASGPGVVPANPNANLPLIITPKRGWIAGQRIEYYDFGPVGNVRKRDNKGSEIREPAYANVSPMYFFFDSQGRPLFSKPAYNPKIGAWTMAGGKDPINPSPQGPPAGGQERTDYYSAVYLQRPRDVLRDEARGSSQFQRPVIETLAVNGTGANTTGLFEVVEITVKDGYNPDAIKSSSTIATGVADGRLSQRRTGKVINCPLVDERTHVVLSAMNNNIPRPRIQYWYRTKMGECFLANGWETIGEVIDETKTATDPTNLRLFGRDDLGKRVSTFDASDFDVGVGQPGATHAVTAAVGKLYTPYPVRGTRTTNDDIAIALPRHKATDAGGYSPIAWLWDIILPATPTYQPGAIKDLVNVDLANAFARDVSPAVTTSNIAIIGAATKCRMDHPEDCTWGMTCNPFPDVDIATFNFPVPIANNPMPISTVYPPEAGQNIMDVTIAREGGPRCDVPAVGYGQYCGAGVSRCEVQSPTGSQNDKDLKALGVASAGPSTTTFFADLATAQKTLETATAAMPPDTAAITAATTARDAAEARVKPYREAGYTADFAGFGYFCYPPPSGTTFPPTLGGFCHIRCDVGASSTASMVTVDLPIIGAVMATFQSIFAGEARCGGLNMLGYKCLPSATTSPAPDRQRVCLRSCNTRNTDAQNAAICGYQLNQKGSMSAPMGFEFSSGQPVRTAITNQMCTAIPSTSACNWNPEFEPRDPAEWGGQ